MLFWRRDPGPCIVCDAPHTTCTAPRAPVVLAQRRDGAPPPVTSSTPAADAAQATLPPGQVTTAHYRRPKGAR